jgi:hypothetical protein
MLVVLWVCVPLSCCSLIFIVSWDELTISVVSGSPLAALDVVQALVGGAFMLHRAWRCRGWCCAICIGSACSSCSVFYSFRCLLFMSMHFSLLSWVLFFGGLFVPDVWLLSVMEVPVVGRAASCPSHRFIIDYRCGRIIGSLCLRCVFLLTLGCLIVCNWYGVPLFSNEFVALLKHRFRLLGFFCVVFVIACLFCVWCYCWYVTL